MEIYEKRMRGARLQQLADEYGLSDSGVCAVVQNVGRSMPELDRSALVGITVGWLMEMRAKVLELSEREGAPVTVGQRGDILREPSEDGEGEIVRDYSLRIKSIETALRIDAAFAKRLGLDAPSESIVKASVQYEVVGLDPEALT
jgi:hypothetical protein